MVSKQVTIKLFFNLSTRTFYIQIGGLLLPVRDKIVAAIQEREGLEIRHVQDIKEMQTIDLNDE